MHETQQHAKPPSRGATALHAKKRKFSRRAIAATLAVVAALVAIPAVGIANTFDVKYSWYKDATGSTYVIETPGQWNAFANLVNGSADAAQAGATQDSFDGKTVELGENLNFWGQDVVPVGGQDGHTFNGTFDGKGKTIDNVTVNAQGATANVGLIGAAGEGSSIANVNVGGKVSLTVAATDNTKAVENIGLLVGSSKGSISNVTNAGALTVSHSMDQTKDIVFPIKNVGGVAGICTGDISGVTNTGAVSVSEPGVPYKAGASDADWEDQSILAINIGGVVGSAGDVDTSIDSKSAAAHGSISNCENTGSIKVDTPKTNGIDRFGNTVYSQSSNVGGVAGYSRGSIDGCTNSGYLDAPHASGMGGIVGSLRAKTTGSTYSGNFTQEGSDDGMASGAGSLAVTNCTNSGSVYGYSFPAGIVGRAGTYTQISGCVNDSSATILGSRSTKPFPAGIVGSSYGKVSYCGNLGTVVAGSWTGLNGTVSQSGGYFASGIAGNLSSFTKNVDGEQQNASGTPELYGCYNAGSVKAMDNMRQRALVGDNGGYVHDNVAVSGLVYNDRLVYGMYADDTETSGGTVYNNVLLSSADFKANAAYDPSKQDSVSRYNPNTTNAMAVLNANASKDGWGTYWTKSDGKVNNGNPVLNRQITWDATDLAGATVEFAANAQYTGLDAVPSAKVTLAGKELQQGTDFRVVPQSGATEVTAAGEKPYTATVVGIGSYSGEAGQLAYGIDKGDLANCTVTIDTKTYNWTTQTPAASNVHVYNLAGKEIASGEYTYAFDQSDKNLSFVDADGYATEQDTGVKGAVNAKKYGVKVTAAADSAHFTGVADGTFSIKTAKIACDKDADKQKQNAYPTSVSYDGNIIAFPKTTDTADNIAWDSMTLRSDLPVDQQNDGLLTVSYTGTNIKPTINDVVYKGKSLTLGKDYRVVYGASLNEGQVVKPGEENLGKAGGEDYGYVIARYISGGNFSNYDNMKFKIVDEGKDLDIADAQVKGTDDIVFEQGGVYTPVTVWYGGSQLKEGADYTIAYTNNDKLGTATYTITGMGRYAGTKTGSFKLVEGVPYELQYAYNADGTATVTGVEYKGALKTFDLVIPATVEKDGATYTVTAIADKAFGGTYSDFSGSAVNESKTKIASVSVPATVKSLGAYAFGSSSSDITMAQLKSVTFADGSQLETIGNSALRATGVSDITIPAGVKSVGEQAFAGNDGTLKTVTFLSESASMPTFATSVLTKSSFYGVRDVTAKAYDDTAAAAFTKSMVSSNRWKFDSLGSVPAKSEFTVSFDALGGTPVPAAQTVKAGAAATKPATDPSKDGATFAGWFESTDGGKTLAAAAYDFATPVTADKTLYAKWETAEQAALAVEVYQADGKTLEKTVSLTADELAAMATTDGDAALGQYYKGGTWSVYRSTDYVTYDDLFANAGVTVGKYDTVQACAADGSGKYAGTLAQMKAGKWYPNAAADGSLGEAADGSQPAGLALSYQLGSGSTASEALKAAEAAKADTQKAPLQIMGVSDGNAMGNRFWSNVTTVKVVRDAATALTVEVQDADGTVTDTKAVTAAELKALATTDGDAALGQYYKNNVWNVYRSTNYVAYGDLFESLGLSVGDDDQVTAWQGGSAGKFTGTLGQMKAGKWYPNATASADGKTVTLGDAAQTLPAGLALDASIGTGSTPAAALTAATAAKADDSKAPLQLMGAWDGATGGNRFWSGVDKVVVKKAEAPALAIEVLAVDGSVEKAVNLTASELKAMATTDGVALGQYYKGGAWNVYRSTNYVAFDDLFANAGVTVGKYDTVQTASADGFEGLSMTLAQMNTGKWYPNASADGSLGEAADGSQPAGLALSYQLASGSTAAEALAAAEKADVTTANAPLQIMGVGSDGNVAGKRFSKGVATVKVQRVDPEVLTVEVQDADGTVTDTKAVKASELEALATTDDVALGQYYKGGKWSVYRSTDYVAYDDLFKSLGLSVGDYDEVTAWQGGSAGKFTGTLGQMKAGKWYPNATASADGKTVTLGDAAQTLPAGLALTASYGQGSTASEALAAAEAAKADDSKAPLQLMGAWDGATGGNRFWSGVDKVVVKKAATALNIVVKDAQGNVEQTVPVMTAQLNAMATTDNVALGQYYKGGAWNVYRSTNYVTYDDLFANMGVTVGKYDVVKACAADGGGKWSGTLATMNNGYWYPDATASADGKTVTLGDAAQQLPAGLALNYQLGTGATAAEALTVAEKADVVADKAPLQLMGVCDNTTGGNRFWSNVATIEVTRNAGTALTVEVQDATGKVTSSKDVSYADLLAWASDEEARGQYYKGGWNVYRSTNYVTFDSLIANTGLEVSGADLVVLEEGSTKAWTGTLAAANAGKWYPNAEADASGKVNLGEAEGSEPAGLMLTYAKGNGSTVAAALENATEMGSERGIVSTMGAWDGATGGNRFWTGLTKLVFKQQLSIVDVKGDEGGFGYKQGDIKATVDAKFAEGMTNQSYQWYSLDSAVTAYSPDRVAGTPIEGATSATYELPAGKDAGTYTVYCVVSGKDKDGNAVSATSDPVDLVVAKRANAIAWVGEGFDASSNSVTVTADTTPDVTADGNVNATVQYAISTSAAASADELTWQDSKSFTDLDADATYYVYAKVSGLKNYEDAISTGLKVATKAAGVVADPVLSGVAYDPAATLADIALPAGWTWDDPTVVPTVKVGAYAATFTPTEEQLASTDYSAVVGWDTATKTVKRQVALAVAKATPTITAAPSASSLTFGQTLADSTLSGGAASVDGTFTWADSNRVPQVAESGKVVMQVVFVPADSDNYNTVSTNVAVTVAPKDLAQSAVTITVPGQTYTGAALEPALTVVYNGVALVAGTDYDVAYANNVEVGTAAYTVTFKGNYAGAVSGTFDIAKAPDPVVPSTGASDGNGAIGNGGAAAATPAAAAANATTLAPRLTLRVLLARRPWRLPPSRLRASRSLVVA